MNIERGLPLPGMTKAGETRAPSASASNEHVEKPAFELPPHDAAPSTARATRGRVAPQREPQPPAAEPARANAHGTARSDDEAKAPAQSPANAAASVGPAARDVPNAAARRDGRVPPAATTGPDDPAEPSAASAEISTKHAEGGHPLASTADGVASLPDRMLAMLSCAPMSAPPPAPLPTAAADTRAAIAVPADTAATIAGPAVALVAATITGDLATVLPTSPTLPAPPTVAAPSSDAAAAARTAPTLGLAIAADAAIATTSNIATSTATSPTDAFAALAAFADRTRDTPAAADDGTAPGGTAFAPLLARSVEAPQAAARSAPVVAPAPLPLLLDAEFDDGLGARVTWMAEQRIDHAQIRVSPEALGPIDVRLQLDGHRVNAQFHAAHADVRQALESGMDRLRELLGRQGMELGQAQVGSGSRQGSDGRANARPTDAAPALGDATSGDASKTVRVAIPRSRGLLDEYA